MAAFRYQRACTASSSSRACDQASRLPAPLHEVRCLHSAAALHKPAAFTAHLSAINHEPQGEARELAAAGG